MVWYKKDIYIATVGLFSTRKRSKKPGPISEKTQKYLTPSCLAHTAAFCQTVGIEFHAKILTNRRHPHR